MYPARSCDWLLQLIALREGGLVSSLRLLQLSTLKSVASKRSEWNRVIIELPLLERDRNPKGWAIIRPYRCFSMEGFPLIRIVIAYTDRHLQHPTLQHKIHTLILGDARV